MGMMILLCLAMGLWWCVAHKPTRHLPLGRFVAQKTFHINGNYYTIEEVAFDDYQEAIHGYFCLVPAVLALGQVCEERYDFFDFYSVAVRFSDRSARLLRLVDKVRLIQSDTPIPLDDFEQIISQFAYQDL